MSKVSPRTVGIIFGSIFIFLICALAYNMGGSSEQAKTSDHLFLLKQRLDRETDRKASCSESLAKLKDETNVAESATAGLQDALESTQNRIQEVQINLAKAQKSLTECEADLEKRHEELRNSPTSNLPDRVAKARNAVIAAQKHLIEVNTTRSIGDKNLLRLIFSYIQANTAMSKQLKAKQQSP